MIDDRVRDAYNQMLKEGENVTLAALRRRAGVSSQVASEGLRELRSGLSPHVDLLPGHVAEIALKFGRDLYQAGVREAQTPQVRFELKEGSLDPEVAAKLPLTDLVPGLRDVTFGFDDGQEVSMEADDLPAVDLERLLTKVLEARSSAQED